MVAGVLVVLVAAGSASGAPARAGAAVTRGELAVQMARASGVKLPTKKPETAAASVLLERGISLGGSLKGVVTEANLVEIGRALGTQMTTAHPEAPVTPSIGRAFVQAVKGSLASALAAGGPPTQMPHVSCQGRESREGRKGTPASQANINATADPCEEPVP
jgi:hypothetical protein